MYVRQEMQYVAELHGWTKFVSMPDQYSLVQRGEEQEMFPLLADQGVGSLPWSPLAAGVIARRWGQSNTTRGKDNPQADFDGHPLWKDSDKPTIDAVERIASDRGVAMATIALAWVLKNPVVDAPIGATKPHQLPDAVAALDIALTEEEITALEEHYMYREPTYF